MSHLIISVPLIFEDYRHKMQKMFIQYSKYTGNVFRTLISSNGLEENRVRSQYPFIPSCPFMFKFHFFLRSIIASQTTNTIITNSFSLTFRRAISVLMISSGWHILVTDCETAEEHP